MDKHLRIIGLVATAGLVVAACGGAAPPPAPPPPPAETPAPAAETAAPPAGSTVVADFASTEHKGNLGGEFGIWASAAPDPVGKAEDSIVDGAWRIAYDISAEGAYGGTWLKLNGLDGTRYRGVSFRVKAEGGAPVDFNLELKVGNPPDVKVGRFRVTGVGAEWRTVETPLSAFNLPALTPLFELTTVFDKETTQVRKGVVFIDDITLLP